MYFVRVVITKALPKSLGLLLAIGFVDLLATAILHARGMITEMNPIMRPVIERSEWQFAIVKGATLIGAGIVLAHYAQDHRRFVRNACLLGSATYATVWVCWFMLGR